MYSGTLEIAGAPVVVVGDVELGVFFCNALSTSVAIDQVFYCSGAVCYCGHYFVSICDGASGDLFVVEMRGVCEMLAVGRFYVAYMCSVVFW